MHVDMIKVIEMLGVYDHTWDSRDGHYMVLMFLLRISEICQSRPEKLLTESRANLKLSA